LINREAGTFLKARFEKNKTAVKKWISNSATFAKGNVYINKGAHKALLDNDANSLLPIGIEKIEGDFKQGDIIAIIGDNDIEIGFGKAAYSSTEARSYIKQQNQQALVHYNYLTIK
ncbi:glutamate 5-kinase, partial [Flavobacteriaceae bacterium]|nr:glutamate 5-kinase [Flavobacteriaceae bacterium]